MSNGDVPKKKKGRRQAVTREKPSEDRRGRSVLRRRGLTNWVAKAGIDVHVGVDIDPAREFLLKSVAKLSAEDFDLNHDDLVKRKFYPLFEKLARKWKAERRNEPLEVFNWHALRHFAISCWIDAGLPPKTVQTFAGHSSVQFTMDRYGHLFRSNCQVEAMDEIAAEIYELKPYRPHEPPRRDAAGRFERKP